MNRPRVYTLCGSTRFPDAFALANMHLSLQGHIVIGLGMMGHADEPRGARFLTSDGDETDPAKRALDQLHWRKIDLSDAIYVVNPGGYVGSSTRRDDRICPFDRQGGGVDVSSRPCLTVGFGGIMTVYKFTGPSATRRYSGKCPRCGKRTTRSRTFQKTVNPLNCDKETGEPKTWDEVRADVILEADAWVPDFRHEECILFDKLDAMELPRVTRELSHARHMASISWSSPKTTVTWENRVAAYEARLAVLNSTSTTETP